MADAPPVSGPLPLWYTAACQTHQYRSGLAGGWGGEEVFDALAVDPTLGDATPSEPTLWLPGTHYSRGDRVITIGNVVLECITAGTSGADEEGIPPIPVEIGAHITDGSVTWLQITEIELP